MKSRDVINIDIDTWHNMNMNNIELNVSFFLLRQIVMNWHVTS